MRFAISMCWFDIDLTLIIFFFVAGFNLALLACLRIPGALGDASYFTFLPLPLAARHPLVCTLYIYTHVETHSMHLRFFYLNYIYFTMIIVAYPRVPKRGGRWLLAFCSVLQTLSILYAPFWLTWTTECTHLILPGRSMLQRTLWDRQRRRVAMHKDIYYDNLDLFQAILTQPLF